MPKLGFLTEILSGMTMSIGVGGSFLNFDHLFFMISVVIKFCSSFYSAVGNIRNKNYVPVIHFTHSLLLTT